MLRCGNDRVTLRATSRDPEHLPGGGTVYDPGMRLRLALLSVLLLGSACTRIRLVDDVDLTFDFTPLVGPSNLLHQPYVVGSQMNLYVDHSDENKDLTGWSLRSSDPDIFSIDDPTVVAFDKDTFRVHCHANGAGTARLEVLNEHGSVVHRTSVDVERPDRVELLAHGPLLVEHPSLDPRTTEPRVLAGGTATFLVRYYLGNRLLHGNGALSVPSTNAVTASTPQSFLFEDRDWLQVTPYSPGDSVLEVSVGGQKFSDLMVHSVPQTDITEVRILGENETHARKGEWLVALAQSYDASARPIYGVEYNWELDGQAELGEGDLYRYQYDPKQKRNLAARYGQLDAVAVIHGEGYVDSSNRIGCNAVDATPNTRDLSLLMVVAGALIAARRSRRRRA